MMKSALKFISFFESLVPGIQNFDPRDVLCEMYSVIMDQHEYIGVVAPNMPHIFEAVLCNDWYLGFVRNLLEEESSTRTYSNRYAIACILNYLISNKIDSLKDTKSREGGIVLQLFQMCFESLPRIQNNDLQRAPQLAANGVPGVERVVQPYIISFLRHVIPCLSRGGNIIGYMKAIRSLFFALAATNKFLDIQANIGTSGLHVQIVDASLSLLNSPVASSKEAEEMCAEICLLVPARLEHLIPLIPKMMHAAVVALNSGDRSVHIALRVLDVWVESFNPEFIERSMSAVTEPLMKALWAHIKPSSQGPFGHKVAGMLGKMGGRGRRWLGENASVDYKDIPEYGLRVILAFPPHTSFLVPLDRCVQLSWSAVSSYSDDSHKRRNALRLLQICAETLTRLHLPGTMLAPAEADMESIDATDNENLGKLKDLLFNSSEPPQIPSDLVWPTELGVKTKKQHAAEKKMLETVLTALISSSYVEDEIDACDSRGFAHATCRHFALLMSSGWANMAIPPWAPPTSRMVKYDVLGGIPAYVATLKHLQPHILLDAFEQGLMRKNVNERLATVECMSVFLDTLIEIGHVQQDKAEHQEKEVKLDSVRDKLARDIPYLNIQQDLITRARHCCYGTTWSSKLGGVLGLEALAKKMTQPLLIYAAHYIIKALMHVLRSLPDNAVLEIDTVRNVMIDFIRRTVEVESPERKQSLKEDGEDEEEEEEEEEPQVTTRRGKRGKRSKTISRKKQRTNVNNDKVAEQTQSRDNPNIERDLARVQNDLLQAVMSSKNNDAVRAVAIECLEILSTASGSTIGSMLDQILTRQPESKSLLERRILPLRSILAQTNYAHSTAFLFRYCPSLTLTDSLCTFVADCCTILEQDDATIAAFTSIRGQQPKQLVISKLKIACLEVLVSSWEWPSFRDAGEEVKVINHNWESVDPRENVQVIGILRARMVSAFVRNLGSHSETVINLCKHGLQLAKKFKIIEKVNLNEALRPVLLDTATISRLDVDRLDHLHRLLDVISDNFQKTLGEKFIEHLQAWIDYEQVVLELSRNRTAHAWEPGTECEVAVKMLDVFHKLPFWAADFLESQTEGDNTSTRPGLVVLTIGLEQGLVSLPGPAQACTCWSPYRDPLVKFLSKYPDKTIDYFVKATRRLSTPDYFYMFQDIIQHPSGRILLERLMERESDLIEALAQKSSEEDSSKARNNCIELVKTLCDLCPNWLPKSLYKACLSLWIEQTDLQGKCYSQLTTILMNYVRRNPTEVDIMLRLPDAFVKHASSELSVLKEYLTKDFPRESSHKIKQQVRADKISLGNRSCSSRI
jgi:transformation/transcription domain-associated protein